MSYMNKNGATRCTQNNQERYEVFTMGFGRKAKEMVQYDYRNQKGELRRSRKAIESHARTRLGMIMPGEIFFIAPEEDS